MAKKKIGIYTNLVGTFNNKVEDLYLIVDKERIIFSVKNIQTNEFVALEDFENSVENKGWHQLIAYLQNNSKLIQHTFLNIYFVWNSSKCLLTKSLEKENALLYQQEFELVHGNSNDEELYINSIQGDKKLVFTVPDALNTLLTRSFPTGKWHHYMEFVLKDQVQDGAYLFLFENSYCLRLVQDGKDKLSTFYTIEEDDQNCYTILNASIHILKNIQQFDLKIWGIQQLNDSFVNALVPYFKSYEIVIKHTGEMQTSLLNSYPNHHYNTYFIF